MINDERILKKAKELFSQNELNVEACVRNAVEIETCESDFPIKIGKCEFTKESYIKALIIQFVCEE